MRGNIDYVPWFSVRPLLRGELQLVRPEAPESPPLASGPPASLLDQLDLRRSDELLIEGDDAVIDAEQLGDVKSNPLEIQKVYFGALVVENPTDDTLPFTYAQVLRELGEDREAEHWYDRGTALARSNWYRRLPLFLLPSLAAAFLLWHFSFPILSALAGLTGPALWLYIYRNRRHWLPIVGFWRRAEIAANVDMADVLSKLK